MISIMRPSFPGESCLSARHKLNDLHVWTIGCSAIGLALVTQSLMTGLIAAAILYAFYLSRGFIRFDESTSKNSPLHRRRRRRQ
jgi:hypothetical protein